MGGGGEETKEKNETSTVITPDNKPNLTISKEFEVNGNNDPDNGYDEQGNKIDNRGGNETDYLYDRNGDVISYTPVKLRLNVRGPLTQYEVAHGAATDGYGRRADLMPTGAIAEDNTLFNIYAGGKVGGAILSSVNKSLVSATGGIKQWLRVGKSFSHNLNAPTYSLRWGAGGKYWMKIGSESLQSFNKWVRQLKLPGNNWRVKDPGHFHLKRLKK